MLCHCGKPAEWAGQFCQEHWEEHCDRLFWEMATGYEDKKIDD